MSAKCIVSINRQQGTVCWTPEGAVVHCSCLVCLIAAVGFSHRGQPPTRDFQARSGSDHHTARLGWQAIPVHTQPVMPPGNTPACTYMWCRCCVYCGCALHLDCCAARHSSKGEQCGYWGIRGSMVHLGILWDTTLFAAACVCSSLFRATLRLPGQLLPHSLLAASKPCGSLSSL